MPGPEPFLFDSLPPVSGGLLAYGPAPGMELIPYFMGLAAWAGLAFLAVLLAPFSALLRRLRSAKNTPPPEPKNETRTTSLPDSPGEGSRNGN
jgi:hypothetical protein